MTVASTGPHGIRCEVAGEVRPLIDALAGHDIVTLTSREPSLEEIFLRHYDRPAANDAA